MALGMGSLTNNISLTVQDLGVGESTLISPIDNADIKFGIEKVPANTGGYKNIIRYCVITNTDVDDVIIPGSLIFCKLTDADGNVAAEGTKLLATTLTVGESTRITIDDPQLIQSQVQNIHDVILVVQGPTP
jgi:hypothetical protein